MALSGGRISHGIALFNKLGHVSSDVFSTQRSTLSPFFIATANSQALRNYATSAGQKEQKIKVPLALFGGAGNYASALYIAAVKANILERVESEIVVLVEATKRSPKFLEFTMDLSVPKDSRVKAIQAICDDSKFSDITRNFPTVVAENGRLKSLVSITKKFVELTMAYKGEVKATVTTVIPLPPQEEHALKETLQAIIGARKKVHLQQKIDPSILRGLVVEFNQKVLKTRALQMERFLREPISFADI